MRAKFFGRTDWLSIGQVFESSRNSLAFEKPTGRMEQRSFIHASASFAPICVQRAKIVPQEGRLLPKTKLGRLCRRDSCERWYTQAELFGPNIGEISAKMPRVRNENVADAVRLIASSLISRVSHSEILTHMCYSTGHQILLRAGRDFSEEEERARHSEASEATRHLVRRG